MVTCISRTNIGKQIVKTEKPHHPWFPKEIRPKKSQKLGPWERAMAYVALLFVIRVYFFFFSVFLQKIMLFCLYTNKFL